MTRLQEAFLIGITALSLLGCQTAREQAEALPRATANLVLGINQSLVIGTADFAEGPTGVIVGVTLYNLSDGTYRPLLHTAASCNDATLENGYALTPALLTRAANDTLNGRGFLPGAKISGSGGVLGHAVMIWRDAGGQVACGIVR